MEQTILMSVWTVEALQHHCTEGSITHLFRLTLPPILASYATPTPQMLLLATAATSPAQRVPCLETKRKKERDRKKKKQERLVNELPPIFGGLLDPMSKRSTAERHTSFYRADKDERRLCPCLQSSAQGPRQMRQNKPTGTAGSWLWFLWTNPN